MTPPDFSPAATQQELQRVLGLVEAVEAAEVAFRNYQPATLQPFELQEGTGGNMLVSMTPEAYTLQRTMHAAQTRVEQLGLDTARRYAEALGEIARLREAVLEIAADWEHQARDLEVSRLGAFFKRAHAKRLRAALASALEEQP